MSYLVSFRAKKTKAILKPFNELIQMVPDIVKLRTKDFEFKSTVENEYRFKKGTKPAQLAIINNSTGQCFLCA